MKRRPFLFIGLASFCAAMLCTLVSPSLAVILVPVAAVCLMAVSFLRPSALPPSLTALTALFAVIVSLLFAARTAFLVNPQLALDGTTATVTMRIEETVSVSELYIARVESGTLKKGTRLCFWPTESIAPKDGDLITAEITLLAAYDVNTEDGHTAKANGVFLYAWPTDDATLVWEDGQSSLSLSRKALYALRDNIHTTLYRHLNYDTAALAEAMLLGRRNNLALSTRYAFRAAGTYHLLAVSGTHLGILTGAVLFLLRKTSLSRRTIALIAMLCVIVFVALCGFTSSVTRAGTMMLIILGGQLFRRRADGLNSVGLAATGMLLADPFCLYDIGWQLSFAATLGLLWIVPIWDREVTKRLIGKAPRTGRLLAPVSSAVGITLSATLTTAPLSAWHFGGISTMFLPGNLIAVPLVSMLLPVYFIAVLLAFIPALGNLLFRVGNVLSDILIVCVSRLSSVSVAQAASTPFITVWLFALLAALTVGYCRRRMRGVWRASVVMLVVLLVGNSAYTAISKRLTHLASAPCDSLTVTVRTDTTDGLILSSSSPDIDEAAMLLYDEGIFEADWLLWLGTPSDITAVLSAFPMSAERVLVLSDDGISSFAGASALTVLEDGGKLTIGSAAVLERNGDFICVIIDGKTACLVPTSRRADAAALPPAQRHTQWLCTDTSFENRAYITAEQTTVFCHHSQIERQKGAFPDAVIAIEGDTQRLTLRRTRTQR